MSVFNGIRAFFGFVMSSGVKFLLWALLIVFFGSLTYSNIKRLELIDADNTATQAEIEAANGYTDELIAESESYDSDAFIEKAARTWLGLCHKDEIIFIKRKK